MAVPSKLKLYTKQGNKNYREKRLLEKLQEAIAKKMDGDPSFAQNFKPATNFDELKALHDKYCSQEVEFTEIKSGNGQTSIDTNDAGASAESDLDPKNEAEKTTGNPGDVGADSKNEGPDLDPFNREEPIVRDYVLEEGFSNKDGKDMPGAGKQSFEEPVSFGESFSMPDDVDEKSEVTGAGNNRSGEGSSSSNNNQSNQNTPKQQKSQPLNPAFDDMSAQQQRKETQQFAKYIVTAVCFLAEKGFVYYAVKDINDAKLAEYEIEDSMNLSLILQMGDGNEATVRQFFQQKCYQAEQLSKIDEQEKADLTAALAQVMMEKGIAPTPMQKLAMIGLSIIGKQAINLMVHKSETNHVLDQLRALRAAEIETAQKTRKHKVNSAPVDKPSAQQANTPPAEPVKSKSDFKAPVDDDIASGINSVAPESFPETSDVAIENTNVAKKKTNKNQEAPASNELISEPVPTIE